MRLICDSWRAGACHLGQPAEPQGAECERQQHAQWPAVGLGCQVLPCLGHHHPAGELDSAEQNNSEDGCLVWSARKQLRSPSPLVLRVASDSTGRIVSSQEWALLESWKRALEWRLGVHGGDCMAITQGQ